MNALRTSFSVAVLVAAAACGSTSEPGTTPKPQPSGAKVDVAIASVTLADDCGGGPTTMPPISVETSAHSSTEQASAKMAAGASLSQAYGDRACEQSSVQLRVANGSDASSTIAIQKVELIDEHGEKVADLTARAPSRWADDTYQAWDQQVAPSETLQVSYALNAPHVQRGATYTVRVTVTTGDGERTIEHEAMLEAEASLPPGAVT